MPYTPPAGNAVEFQFPGSAYTPPAGNAVEFSFVPESLIGSASLPITVELGAYGAAALPLAVSVGSIGLAELPLEVLVAPFGVSELPLSVNVGPYGLAALPLAVSVVEFGPTGQALLPLSIEVGAFGSAALPVSLVVGDIGSAALPVGVLVGLLGHPVLPVSINIAVIGTAALPIAVVVGGFGSAALEISVSVVAAAIADGSATVADGGNSAAVWGALVTVDGVDVSADVIGEIVIEAEEGAARVADLALYQTGTIDFQDWDGVPVMIAIADMSSGAPTDAMPLFTGVVDLPRVDMASSRIMLTCTDNRQGIISGLSRAQIAALVGGYWSSAVFSKAASAWVYANDRLSTVTAALDLSPAGVLRLTPWAAKPVADLSFADDSVLDGGVVPDIAERGSLINRIDIDFGYRFPRLKSEGHVLNYDYLAVNETSFVIWVRDGNPFLYRQAVLSAISSAGGTIVSIDWTPLPTTGQVIPGIGGAPAGVWIPNPYLDPLMCLGFSAVVSFDFSQQAEEQHQIAVVNQKSIDAVGLMRTEISGGLEGVYADPVAVEQNIFLYKAGTTSIPPLDLAIPAPGTTVAATPTLTSDSDRAAAEAAMETLTAVAMTRIFKSHRSSTVPFSVPLNPVLDTDKTVAINAQGVAAVGKVRKLTHRLNADAGTAISDVQIAICSAAGVGIVHDEDAIAAPAGIADGASGTLADPVVVWNGLAGQDGELTITFPGVVDAQRNTDLHVIASTFAAPLAEDLLTVTL